MDNDSRRQFFRHTLATLSYRGGKAIRNAPDKFGSYKVGSKTRTPIEILAHIGDLLDWALSIAEGKETWKDGELKTWDEQCDRFFKALKKLDDFVASGIEIKASLEKLFQGPIADALTHVGQINLLRRLAESPVRGENYFRAEIETGSVGPEQSDKRIEFD